MKYIVLAILLFSSTFSFSQRIGFDPIEPDKVSPWIAKNPVEYQAVYHFGDSEDESDFILIIGIDQSYAQIRSGSWPGEGKEWVWTYRNMANLKIEGNRIASKEFSGEFVIYDNGKEKIKGLKVFNPWSSSENDGEWEVGLQSYVVKDYFSGKYPQASMRLLGQKELKNVDKKELQIMRDEIFARYGHIFNPGGEMEKHFKAQDWYSPQHKDVTKFLTELEKTNVKVIQEAEGK